MADVEWKNTVDVVWTNTVDVEWTDTTSVPPVGWTGKINTITNPAKITAKAVADIAKVVGQS